MHQRFQQRDCAHNVVSDEVYRQPMLGYVIKWESCSVQLVAIKAPMDEALLIMMFTESFGDRSKSRYAIALSVLLTKQDLL